MLGGHFRHFRAADPRRLHFAAHSHHPWPDATRSAHQRYWLDSATLVDRKWERVLGEVVPKAQDHVARLLHLSDARQVAYELEGIMMAMNLYLRLLKDRRAVDRARLAFKRLVASNGP